MKFSIFEKDKYIAVNENEFGRFSPFLNWAQEKDMINAQEERDKVLEKIENLGGQFEFSGAKTDSRDLSPGCRLCGEGKWSCLFISGICNATCFYCPSRQDSQLKPATNTFEFNSPDEYTDYVNALGFKGVSFSGGEPFIVFDLLQKYLESVRKNCDPKIYTWVYTNGSLVDSENLKRLRDLGLNEIRFDIGAYNYSLKKVELAAEIIDTVTIEIPMVPDHFELVKGLLRPMKEAGVKHLNLHQMRVNPYNLPRMIEKDYEFIHGRKVTVFKSELNALKTLFHSLENDLVPVNYCSFVFKESFQSCAARKRYAARCVEKDESVTGNGYLRRISLIDPDDGSEKTVSYDELLSMPESEEFFRLTYFNPTASGRWGNLNDPDYKIYRPKMASYKLSHCDILSLFKSVNSNSEYEKKASGRMLETIPDCDTTGRGYTLKQFYEIFNFEILRGGFADYF
jgi:pyruvate formate-lyase activating enzyme-like uncharacterized protein